MAVSVQLKKSETYGISTRDRAKFGWLSVEGVDLPYIVRDGREKFIPVKMVETYILSYYPSTYPKELQGKPPLVCTFMKQDECDLLNKCCGKRQGFVDKFAKTDPVVKLNDFLAFFGFVKSAYPDVVIGVVTPHQPAQQPKAPSTDYGWVLVKDAMIPYIVRGSARFAPINVIRGAAQMLIGVQVDNTCATEPEVHCLNTMCQKVGLVFTFQTNTCLTNLRLLKMHDPQCVIQDLPKENPMDFVNTAASAKEKVVNGGRSVAQKVRAPLTQAQTSSVPGGPGVSRQRPSASKSLQALANMAKGQPQNSPRNSPPIEIDAHETSSNTSANQTPKASQSTPNITKKSPFNRPAGAGSAKPPAAAATAAASTKHSAIIEPMECHGKTISCLIRGRSSLAFALVEAVCRVYFPNSSLVDFIHFMEMDLAVTLYVLKKSEEDAFIDFYGIPTKQLRCNQVIKLKDLRDRMPRLVARFGAANAAVGFQSATSSDSRGSSAPTDNGVGVSGVNPKSTPLTTDHADAMLTSNDISPVDSPSGSDVTQPEGQGRKSKSLENTIMRILDKKQGNENDNDMENGVDVKEDGDDGESDKEQMAKSQPTNKRKATPRRCTPQKKLTLIIDGVRTEIEENSSACTEDSDMEEYA